MHPVKLVDKEIYEMTRSKSSQAVWRYTKNIQKTKKEERKKERKGKNYEWTNE